MDSEDFVWWHRGFPALWAALAYTSGGGVGEAYTNLAAQSPETSPASLGYSLPWRRFIARMVLLP